MMFLHYCLLGGCCLFFIFVLGAYYTLCLFLKEPTDETLDSPRTVWFNEYENGRLGYFYNTTEEAAANAKEMKILPKRQVKFVEVKDE